MIDHDLFPELLTSDQVAELMGVDAFDVEQWAEEGILKSYRIDSAHRYKVEDVKNFIMDRQNDFGLNT
jgi:hypothetical protein